MRFFFDNNFSPKIAQAITLLDKDDSAEHLKDRFPHDENDETWLKYIGKHKIFLITKDRKIRKHPAELAALNNNNVGAFFLISKNQTHWQEIKQLINAWEEIKRLACNSNRPFAFQIPQRGRIKPISI